jgi:purine-binding chemotaxis protein CheW
MEIQGGKFLTFTLGNEEYGIPIQKVKEIIGIMDITNIPKTPQFIKGVINLRGKIIPVMDLRLKFGFEEKAYNQRTCIIVVEINIADTKRMMGIVVDTVSEVVNIQKWEIEPPPQYDLHADNEFLIGMGKVKGKVILLLDIEQVLSSEELVLLKGLNK